MYTILYYMYKYKFKTLTKSKQKSTFNKATIVFSNLLVFKELI